jgi:predicted Zn-dependent protease with MMP-like domain
MKDSLRDYFDAQVDWVLDHCPPQVHELLEEVAMYVEDHPPRRLMQEMGVRRRRDLCGLHTGIPLTERSVLISGVPTNAIYLYREGILWLATDQRGRIDQEELRRQIRITLLHELGHYHGLDEDELEALGYG